VAFYLGARRGQALTRVWAAVLFLPLSGVTDKTSVATSTGSFAKAVQRDSVLHVILGLRWTAGDSPHPQQTVALSPTASTTS